MNKISAINFKKISISKDETYHVYEDAPLYTSRFLNVMSYHDPGVAAVKDKDGALHINLEGKPIYERKFQKTFGFYEGLAAVMDNSVWYHIDLEGKPVYEERYHWVGNFQEGRSPVRTKSGYYFHIKLDGKLVYTQKYQYVGDFKYGIAVVYLKKGVARHIDLNGNFIYDLSFEELDVFHKGYAIAKDKLGYFHIDKHGKPAYKARFKWIEPFYNEQAFACTYEEKKVVIDQSGTIIHDLDK